MYDILKDSESNRKNFYYYSIGRDKFLILDGEKLSYFMIHFTLVNREIVDMFLKKYSDHLFVVCHPKTIGEKFPEIKNNLFSPESDSNVRLTVPGFGNTINLLNSATMILECEEKSYSWHV